MSGRLVLTILVIFSSSTVKGGSKCPPRTGINPCLCHEIFQQNSTRFTLVTCSSFSITSKFLAVPRLLPRMLIDRLVITDYNSKELTKVTLPDKWAEDIRIRELEFQGVKFSPIIFGNNSLLGQEVVLEKLVLRNIFSVNSTLCGGCGPGVTTTSTTTPSYYRYESTVPQQKQVTHLFVHLNELSTVINLREIDLSWNQFETIRENPFPSELTNLQVIDLSHNIISHIAEAVFAPFRNLRVLKLSHNRITNLPPNTFHIGLSLLDLSYNQIRNIQEDVVNNFTLHSEIILVHNYLQTFPISTWLLATKKASRIDVRDNFFTCDCNIAWIQNEVLPFCEIIGNCATPREMEQLSLKEASLKLKCHKDEKSATESLEISEL